MKVWVVETGGHDSKRILHICKTKKLAVKRLFEERDKLVKKWKELIKISNDTNYKAGQEYYLDMIKILSTDNYEKWSDNYPEDFPFMYGVELEREISDD